MKRTVPFPVVPLAAVIATFVMASIMAWVKWGLIPTEQRVLADGTAATAHVSVYKRSDRGTRGPSYYADLSWQDRDGQPRTYHGLAIHEDAYTVIKNTPDHDSNFPIHYLDGERPVLIADLPDVRTENALANFLFHAFAFLFGVSAIWLLRKLYVWRRAPLAPSQPDQDADPSL